MPPSVVDLSPRVVAARKLRVAVFFPRALAVTLIVVLPLPVWSGPAQRHIAVWFVVVALALLSLTWLAERARRWALVILAIATTGIPLAGFVTAIAQFDWLNAPLAPQTIVDRWERFRRVFPGAAIDWEYDERVGLPLIALFLRNGGPVLLCCRFQNETAYAFAFEEVHARLADASQEKGGQPAAIAGVD